MTDQGLKAVIYPELDEAGMQKLVKDISDSLSSTFVKVGVDTTSQTQSGTESTENNTTSTVKESQPTGSTTITETSKPLTKEEVAEAVSSGEEQTADGKPDVAEKKSMSITSKLGTAIGVAGSIASSVGAFGVGVADGVMKVFKFLEESSEPLRNVMNLFTRAFNLIWMPVGTILARELMPIVRSIFTVASDWVSRADEIFEKEGWAGLIEEAFSTSLDIITAFLESDEFWALLQTGIEKSFNALDKLLSDLFAKEEFWTTLWNFIHRLMDALPDAIYHAIFGEDFNFVSMLDMIEASLKLLVGMFQFFMGDTEGAIKNLGEGIDVFKNWGENIVTAFKAMLDASPIWQTIKSVIEGLDRWLKSMNIDVGEAIEDFGEKQKEGFDKFVSQVSSGDVGGALETAFWGTPGGQIIKGIGGVFGMHAEGGIVTSPEIGIIGEAGPEAIIPLNQLNQVANDYRTITGGATGGNVMYFYINGNNAMEVGEEVQRILEKTVGKASSKMMWW